MRSRRPRPAVQSYAFVIEHHTSPTVLMPPAGDDARASASHDHALGALPRILIGCPDVEHDVGDVLANARESRRTRAHAVMCTD